jgi:hypothetical protein
MAGHVDPKISFTGWVQTSCTLVMMACVFVIIGAAVSRWFDVSARHGTAVAGGPAA